MTVPNDAQVTVGGAAVQNKKISGPGIAMLPAGDYEVEADCPGLPGAKGRVTIASGAITQWLPWAKGYLDIQSDPVGADIVVDGLERGVAPLVVEVEPRIQHHVELKKLNYETYAADVSGDAGSKTLLSGSLTPIKSTPAQSVAPPAAPSKSHCPGSAELSGTGRSSQAGRESRQRSICPAHRQRSWGRPGTRWPKSTSVGMTSICIGEWTSLQRIRFFTPRKE